MISYDLVRERKISSLILLASRASLAHEIYGKYFEAVSAILEQAVAGDLTKDGLAALVREHAFGESIRFKIGSSVGSRPSICTNMVVVAQSVRAPGCGPGGRRFDPGPSPHTGP